MSNMLSVLIAYTIITFGMVLLAIVRNGFPMLGINKIASLCTYVGLLFLWPLAFAAEVIEYVKERRG